MDYRQISRDNPNSLLKEILIMEEVETDLLVDMYRLRSLTSSVTQQDNGASSHNFAMEANRLVLPWVYAEAQEKKVEEKKEEQGRSSIPGLSANESAAAEMLIAQLKKMQEGQNKKDKVDGSG